MPSPSKYKYDHPFLRFGQDLFFVSASVYDSRNWNSRSNCFVRALAPGGGSNARRPAVSVPHVEVNADVPSETSEKLQRYRVSRRNSTEILAVSSRLLRLDDLRNRHHFQTVVSCHCNVLKIAVAYSQASVSLDVCRSSAFVFFA